MPFTSVRNAIPNPVTLPPPYKIILPPGVGIVIPDSIENVLAQFGNPIASGLDIKALPNDFSGPINESILYTPGRQPIGPFARENVAAALVEDPILPPALVAAFAAEQPMMAAGSIVGLWVNLSEAPAGADLILNASIDGVAQAPAILTMLDGGAGLVGLASFNRNEIPFAAGQKVGIMISTGAGWTSVTLDLVAGLLIEA